MGQEFVIKSTTLEDKINQLLPSQGGAQAGVDLSASSMIVPVVNLTEAAEGSVLREDLQTAINLNSTDFDIVNSTNTTIINTTGYYRLFGLMTTQQVTSGSTINIQLTDGTTTKTLLNGMSALNVTSVGLLIPLMFDFVVKIAAGETLRGTANETRFRIQGTATQIADINGNLT